MDTLPELMFSQAADQAQSKRVRLERQHSRWPMMARQWRNTTDSAGASRFEV